MVLHFYRYTLCHYAPYLWPFDYHIPGKLELAAYVCNESWTGLWSMVLMTGYPSYQKLHWPHLYQIPLTTTTNPSLKVVTPCVHSMTLECKKSTRSKKVGFCCCAVVVSTSMDLCLSTAVQFDHVPGHCHVVQHVFSSGNHGTANTVVFASYWGRHCGNIVDMEQTMHGNQ